MAALESRLVITAIDETASTFAAIEARIKAVQASMASINPAMGAVGRASGNVAPAAASVGPAAASVAAAAEETKKSGPGLLTGAVEFAAAAVGLKAAMAGITQAFDQAHEVVRAAAAGMTHDEILDTDRLSKNIARTYPSIRQSSAQNLARNARSIVGSYEEAEPLVGELAKLRIVARGAQVNASEEQLDDEFDKLLNGIEIRGATQNPEEFKHHLNFIAKGLNAFGDTLTASDFYEMFKYGRQATPALSDKFMLETAPALAQELKGSSYGRAVSAFNRAIVAGHMDHDALRALSEYGLVADDDLLKTKTGEIKGLKPGRHIKDYLKAQSDPYAWVQEDLIPGLEKAGITDKAQISAAIGRVFSNQVGAQMVNILALQRDRIDKDARIQEGAGDLTSANLFAKDPKIASMALSNAVANRIASQIPASGIGNLFDKISHWMMPAPLTTPTKLTPLELLFEYEKIKDAQGRADAKARFPGAFGDGVHEQDAMRITRRRINESYRWQAAIAADPEAHRGAVMMNLDRHGPSGPIQVDSTVHGEATLRVVVDVNATSNLINAAAKADQAIAQVPLNPVAGGHSGRMDSDAAPAAHVIHRAH